MSIKQNKGDEMPGEVTRQEYNALIKRLDEHCATQNGSLDKIWDKLDTIDQKLPSKADAATVETLRRDTDKKVSGRPTWAVLTIVSILMWANGLLFTGFLGILYIYLNHV